MKKLTVICITLIVSALFAYSAIVKFFFDTNAVSGNLPASTVKIFYGVTQTNYSNQVEMPLLLNNLNTNTPIGYNANACSNLPALGRYEVRLYGLTLGQPFYYGVKFVNTNGEETAMLFESTCAFTVTNNMDIVAVPPPKNVRVVK